MRVPHGSPLCMQSHSKLWRVSELHHTGVGIDVVWTSLEKCTLYLLEIKSPFSSWVRCNQDIYQPRVLQGIEPILGHNVAVHLIRCQEGKRQNWLHWTLGNWKSPHFFIANQFWWKECWQFPEWFTYFVGWCCILLLIFSVNLHAFYYSNLKVKLWPTWPQFDHCQYPWRILNFNGAAIYGVPWIPTIYPINMLALIYQHR